MSQDKKVTQEEQRIRNLLKALLDKLPVVNQSRFNNEVNQTNGSK